MNELLIRQATYDRDMPSRTGTWECAGLRGNIWLATGSGYVADSPSVILSGREAGHETADEAARAAYRREVVLGASLETVRRKARIDFPDAVPTVFAVAGHDPADELPGEPAEGGRAANLMPWEREMARVARENRHMAILVTVGETAYRAAVAGKSVAIVRMDGKGETARWRVLDGCRKLALFLA